MADAPDMQKTLEAALAANPQASVPVQAATIERWSGALPDALLDIWRTHGFIVLAGGRLRLVDPGELGPVMSHILSNDVDLGGDTHGIAVGVLGEVVVWSRRHGYGFLSPVLATLEMPYILTRVPPPTTQQIRQHVVQMSPELIEAFDPAREKVHARLVARLGSLQTWEVYGTTPVPPPLEGTPVEHYVIADAAEWLEAVYGEVTVTLVDWNREPADLRRVGEPWPEGGPVAAKRRL